MTHREELDEALELLAEHRSGNATTETVRSAYLTLLAGDLSDEELLLVAQHGPMRDVDVVEVLLGHPRREDRHVLEAAWSAFARTNDLAPDQRGRGIQEPSLQVVSTSGLVGAVATYLLRHCLTSSHEEYLQSGEALGRAGGEGVEIFLTLLLDLPVTEVRLGRIVELAEAAEQLAGPAQKDER